MHKIDPEILAHLEWLGFVRPTGLVVSAPALVRAGAILDRRDAEGQRLLRACVAERVFDPKGRSEPLIADFAPFAESVLGWSFSPKGYAGTPRAPIPPELEVPLPDYGETLRPDFAVRELEPKDGASPWQLLVRVLEPGEDFDRVARGHGQLEASAHGRMERLLRQTGVPAGCSSMAARFGSCPRLAAKAQAGSTSASRTWSRQRAGRSRRAMRAAPRPGAAPSLPRAQRLGALLEDSRKFQNEVSEKLAEQVLHALYEFLRGFQAAHDARRASSCASRSPSIPTKSTARCLPSSCGSCSCSTPRSGTCCRRIETFLRYYSLAGLYERLREDAALYPDTMDQRFGAWAQLLVLFRMIHDGAESGDAAFPKRHGVLFDPDRFTFLEGRASDGARQRDERIEPPLVPDGTDLPRARKTSGPRRRAHLLSRAGRGADRLGLRDDDGLPAGDSDRALGGGQGAEAAGRATAVDLEALLERAAEQAREVATGPCRPKAHDKVRRRRWPRPRVEDLHAALLPVIDLAATPDLVPKGAMVLQPSEERRRSGSHYTPRALTEPIVRTTLEPILARLRGEDGRPPQPAQILDLKVCDPAMGSGAFLVEACRQLGDALVEAWHVHGEARRSRPTRTRSSSRAG